MKFFGKIGKKDMFKLYQNQTDIGQIVSCRMNGSTLRLDNGGVIDGSLFNSISGLKPIDGFLLEMDRTENRKFFLHRTFSLGDVLTLIPAYRRLRDLGYEPIIKTSDKYLDILSRLNVEAVGEKNNLELPCLHLDYVVEKDHYHPKLQKMPRTEIYHKIIGLDMKKKLLDWGMDMNNFPEHNWDEKPYVVFQGRGAVDRRALPNNVIQDLIWLMNLDEIRVIYIGEPNKELLGMTGVEDRTKFLFMNGSIADLFSWIAGAKAIISMDSSPMWISYFTNTPVIAILAPSRPEERLGLHPKYPDDAVAVRLNEEVHCEPCFEQSEACNHKYTCFKSAKADRIYELMRDKLIDLWKK